MDLTTSSLDLTKYDQLELTDFNSDSEESQSSGYESSDTCQSENIAKPSTGKSTTEIMFFKSSESLCDNLDYILSMPELCDVVFLVDKTNIPVYGVKAILATRSRVFYQMILHAQRQVKVNKKKVKGQRFEDKLIIEVMDYDEDVFRRFISFIHCGKVKVDIKTLTGLFCAAVEFGMKDLRKACWDYLLRCIDGHKDELMTSLEKYSNHKGIKYICNELYNVGENR